MLVLYSLKFILTDREDDDQSKCSNPTHNLKIIGYLIIIGVALIIWLIFAFVIRR